MKTHSKQMVLHEHLNRRGHLFGGQMMAWMDIAAAMHAFEIMQMDCVTVLADEILFKTPVELGDIVTFECIEQSRGNTSLTVSIKVTKSNLVEKNIEVASSNFKFVAVDENGKPSNNWNNEQ